VLRLASCLLILFVLPGCGVVVPSSRSADEEDIRETVFRYEFENEGSAGPDKTNVYFIEIEDGNDPSPALLKRFAGHKPPVKPKSACTSSARGVKDRQTGKAGVVFYISEIDWKPKGKVEFLDVDLEYKGTHTPMKLRLERTRCHTIITKGSIFVYGGLFVSGLWGNESEYRMVRKGKQWVVDSAVISMRW